MQPTSVIAIFDIGKTNKKVFLFDEQYRIVFSKSACLAETVDEDGEICEDLNALRLFIHQSLSQILTDPRFVICAINFAAYGASLVYTDHSGEPVAPLYNYLKHYPDELLQTFIRSYGSETALALRTASPIMGSLNSGLQLFRQKNESPTLFAAIRYAVHLPQYLSLLVSGKAYSDITSIGCHTLLWHFDRHTYDDWVLAEGILDKLAPLQFADYTNDATVSGHHCRVGIGLHDSSAAIIPYKSSFPDRFLLVSTGTWIITMDPFDDTPLTEDELRSGCLCYLGDAGKPVKASRLFAGFRHDEQVELIAKHFDCEKDWYKTVELDQKFAEEIRMSAHEAMKSQQLDSRLERFAFSFRDINDFASPDEAYHRLMTDIVDQQVVSISLLLRAGTDQLFVDGGFSRNKIFMSLLAMAFPRLRIFAATVAEATALGAALVIHKSWNQFPIPNTLVSLQRYH